MKNNEDEIWKPVNLEGFREYYEVSNKGRVYSIRRDIILKTNINNRNYHIITLNSDGFKRSIMLHRLVALTFIPNPENKPQVIIRMEIKNIIMLKILNGQPKKKI